MRVQIDSSVAVDGATDFVELARRGLHGEVGIATQSDQAPLDWVKRAYERLRSSPELGEKFARGVAAAISDEDAKVRTQALMFFESYPTAAGRELVAEAAKNHRQLFRGVPSPFQDSTTLEWQLLRTIGTLARNGDADALALAYAEVVRVGGQGNAAIAALTQIDPQWVAIHAEEIVRADVMSAAPLLINLQESAVDVGDVGERIAPLAAHAPMFRSLVEDMITDEATRRRILARLPPSA
jgi:hypothetical protein